VSFLVQISLRIVENPIAASYIHCGPVVVCYCVTYIMFFLINNFLCIRVETSGVDSFCTSVLQVTMVSFCTVRLKDSVYSSTTASGGRGIRNPGGLMASARSASLSGYLGRSPQRGPGAEQDQGDKAP